MFLQCVSTVIIVYIFIYIGYWTLNKYFYYYYVRLDTLVHVHDDTRDFKALNMFINT